MAESFNPSQEVLAPLSVAMGVSQSAWDPSYHSINWLELHHAAPLESTRITWHGAARRAPAPSIHCDHLLVASLQSPDAHPAPAGSFAGG